jgi:hypothetical protein
MSADVLALAVRASAHYAGVRGPWRQPTTMVLEADPTRPGWLVVRESHPARSREALLFDPLPRKEKPSVEPNVTINGERLDATRADQREGFALTIGNVLCTRCGGLVFPTVQAQDLHDRFHEDLRR